MATKQILYVPSDNITNQKISILERINRLNELHDPNLMDEKYLEYYASNLGYSVDFDKGEIGNLSTNDTEREKYLRFALDNLPLWYRVKTTRNSIKIMLYSFGIVGDIGQYYTKDYKPSNENGTWYMLDYNEPVSNVPSGYYPTPHFMIWVDLNTTSKLNVDYTKRTQFLNAINSIKPINTVFRNLNGYLKTESTFYCSMHTRFTTRHIKISSDGDSDYWNI